MQMPKSPPELVALFSRVVPAGPDVVTKQMFGYPSAVVRGRMFMSLFGSTIVLRLSDEDRELIIRAGDAAPFEPMEGRPMSGFVAVTERLWSDQVRLRPWIARSLAHTSQLPVKKAKKKAAPKKKKKK